MTELQLSRQAIHYSFGSHQRHIKLQQFDCVVTALEGYYNWSSDISDRRNGGRLRTMLTLSIGFTCRQSHQIAASSISSNWIGSSAYLTAQVLTREE